MAATGEVHNNLRIENEKVTGPVALQLIQKSGIVHSSSDELVVLDNACGGGIVTRELFNLVQNDKQIKRIVTGDLDDRMLAYVKQLSAESGWQQVETKQFDQASAPFDEATFTHVFSNFGIFFSPKDAEVLAETYRILQSGGIAGFASWKAITWWQEIALPALNKYVPGTPELPNPANIFPSPGWTDPEKVRSKLESAGFKDVQVDEYSFTPDVEPEGFSAACAFLVRGLAARLWSKEDNEKFADQIQPAMLRYLKENYADGKWTGKMTAIISLGKKS